MKTLGIFIATPGRRSLWRTLHSIAYQRAPVEDVLVVGDGFHEPTAELVESAQAVLGLPVRYIATRKTRDWGHTQQNYALQHVRGDYLIYQDDDDIFVPRALTEAARLADGLETPHPLIGRIKTPKLGPLWQVAKPEDACLDGHCLLVPNDKKRLGWFTSDYNGDQCYIHTTLRNYKEVGWTDRFWTLTRPHWTLWPVSCSQSLFDENWACTLRRDDSSGIDGVMIACVYFRREPDCDRYTAGIDTYTELTLDEYQDIAEFLVYAAQSKDIWIRIKPQQETLFQALTARNYKEHYRTDKFIELTHDWPPDFWPPIEPFNQLSYSDSGNVLPDWRDAVWGGRPVS